MNKKIIMGVAVGIAIVMAGAGVSGAQTVMNAGTIAGLQAEIQALLAQVQVLQQELAQVTQSGSGTSAGSGWCHTFSANLSAGSTGSEVLALQTALQKQNSSVSLTGTFDGSTAAAVSAFQEKYASQILAPIGLRSGTGFVGSATRATLNNIFRCTTAGPSVMGTNPTGAPIGTSVTITGSGFTTTGNNIHFGTGGIANVSSADGMHLAFQVPSGIGPCDLIGSSCAAPEQQVTPGSYPVSVSNARGTSNSTNFTVGPTIIGSTLPPYVAGINPVTGHVGISVTITGSGFAATGNNIHFGVGGIANVSSADGTHLTFQVPNSVGPCDLMVPGSVCATYEQLVTPGSYAVSVSDGLGTSNTVTFAVIAATTVQ
jgi:peptidoglycan hydrolase-like protein with peptidoglycan-binding domain